MKQLLIAAAGLLATLSAFAENKAPADAEILPRPGPWAEVMLVGAYHFANPGLDEFNTEADDVLDERRQSEIQALVSRLTEWEPDLVLVEWPREEQASADSRYAEYRDGKHRDNRNEIYQLGFRLADMLGHERVGAVDVEHPFFSEEQVALEETPGDRYRSLSEEMKRYGNAFVAASGEHMASDSIGDILAWYNSPRALTFNHDFYLRYQVRQWQEKSQGGAHTVANWYTRNILIFQNILREVEESDGQVKRVVAIYGQGHVPILAQLVADTPFLTLADPLPYLAD